MQDASELTTVRTTLRTAPPAAPLGAIDVRTTALGGLAAALIGSYTLQRYGVARAGLFGLPRARALHPARQHERHEPRHRPRRAHRRRPRGLVPPAPVDAAQRRRRALGRWCDDGLRGRDRVRLQHRGVLLRHRVVQPPRLAVGSVRARRNRARAPAAAPVRPHEPEAVGQRLLTQGGAIRRRRQAPCAGCDPSGAPSRARR